MRRHAASELNKFAFDGEELSPSWSHYATAKPLSIAQA